MRGILLLAVLLLSACQHVSVPPPVNGEIRDLQNGQVLTAQELLERLAKPSRLIVGEQHDNRDHHQLELWLLQSLGEQRPQGSLLLEMLTPDQQPRVDDVRHAPTPPSNLPTALAWQEGWDWALYGPIVRFALTQPYPLLSCLCSPRDFHHILFLRGVDGLRAGKTIFSVLTYPVTLLIRQPMVLHHIKPATGSPAPETSSLQLLCNLILHHHVLPLIPVFSF